MTPTTEGISALDFNGRSEWLPLIAPYSLYHGESAEDTAGRAMPYETEYVHAPTFAPCNNSTAFVKPSFEGELLANVPSSLLSFLNNRRQHVKDGDTYLTIINQKDIDILSSLVKGRTTSRPVVVPLSPAAEAFCNSQGISPYIKVASDLVNKCFSNIKGVAGEVLQDPDVEDQFLVIHVEVKGEIEAVLDMYDKYTEEWVTKVPWPERSKISLSYIII
ncbi:MAG: hypothetical protein QMD32_02950 [Smithellaceae bacterium]|nr:hypothetical protein [Smithellaceae bacterium]